jgi:signal transduction histidine kinase
VLIQDDGRGFEPAGQAEGNGLANMKQRLGNIGGECVVESQAGKGTTVHLRLPVRALEPLP